MTTIVLDEKMLVLEPASLRGRDLGMLLPLCVLARCIRAPRTHRTYNGAHNSIDLRTSESDIATFLTCSLALNGICGWFRSSSNKGERLRSPSSFVVRIGCGEIHRIAGKMYHRIRMFLGRLRSE